MRTMLVLTETCSQSINVQVYSLFQPRIFRKGINNK